jgi:hypothetical protein
MTIPFAERLAAERRAQARPLDWEVRQAELSVTALTVTRPGTP